MENIKSNYTITHLDIDPNVKILRLFNNGVYFAQVVRTEFSDGTHEYFPLNVPETNGYNTLELDDMYEKLINKPVETTNEQPKLQTDLKIELMRIMAKHVDLRNSDKLVDIDLYHSFLDWEKEMYRLIV